ncbi:ribosomal protein S6 kinase-related protein-like isoform X2 [Pristis pectinata]|uniref:ribosomal protein S6 kinase-related protein-like isoform X2 n=1 Tax=Pristis pectinata TaxID=685728 RepID=UPI00223E2620|nr:ribosomal protein S6 kinase-related protein-like isoform X2 [Pristis pectinata]
MGNERSAARGGNPSGQLVPTSRWKGALSKVGLLLSSWYSATFQTTGNHIQEQLAEARGGPGYHGSTGWPFPRFISLFFPVFPYKSQRMDQEFQDIEFIAKGSLGPILKVRQRTNEKIYAVKVLLKAEVVRQGILQQCIDGVVIQKQVLHPFVQGLRECWQTSRLLFIMCDYHCAGDLSRLWTASKPLAESRVRVFAAELGSAIGFLHDFGVIHRDVKMENVLLTERGHLMLTDFGLSRRLWRGERALTICGTVQYMAPEVLRGSPYNHSADWWSLGVLLYALVAGKLLCADPRLRLHRLDAFSEHRFFRGLSFEPQLLQGLPLEISHPAADQSDPEPQLFRDFDWEPGAPALPLAG